MSSTTGATMTTKPAIPSKAATTTEAKPKKTVEPKYRGPNGETWSGRGSTPKWLRELQEAHNKK